MFRNAVSIFTSFRLWLGLATGVFAVWYAVFLFRYRVVALLVDATGAANSVVTAAPQVDVSTARAVVGAVTGLGIPVAILAFFVGFGLFHWQAEADRVAEPVRDD